MLSTTSVDLGVADCGGAPAAPQIVTLQNVGGEPLTYAATMLDGALFSLEGELTAPPPLAPGEAVELRVLAASVPLTSTAGAHLTDTLVVTTSDPMAASLEVALTLEARGATFEITPTLVDFGDVPNAADDLTPPIDLTIRNVGTAAASVTFYDHAGSDATFTRTHGGGTGAMVLEPGASMPSAEVRFDPPAADTSLHVDTYGGLATSDVVCAGPDSAADDNPGLSLAARRAIVDDELAQAVTLRGQATNGALVAVPATVDFGQTDCGGQAGPRVVTLSNVGDAPFDFSAVLGGANPGRYGLTGATGTIAPGANAVVTITANPLPATSAVTDNLYGAELTVTTTAVGELPRVLALRQTARGAILAFDATDAAAVDHTVALGKPYPRQQLRLRNTGNAAIDVQVAATTGPLSYLPSAVTTVPAAGAIGTGQGVAMVAPTDLGPNLGAIAITSAVGPRCAPLPTQPVTVDVDLAGTATQALPSQAYVGFSSQTLCVLTTGGYVACLGHDVLGSRGAGVGVDATTLDPAEPNLVRTATDALLRDVVELESGVDFYCARRADGSAWCWGNLLPMGVDPGPQGTNFAYQWVGSDVIAVAADYLFGCWVAGTGGVTACWGGAGSTEEWIADDWSFYGAFELSDLTKISLHGTGGLGLRADGTVRSFGDNQNGERGDTVFPHDVPAEVPGLPEIAAVHGGGQHLLGIGGGMSACATSTAGDLWCWGREDGANGNGATTPAYQAVRVVDEALAPLTGVTATAVAGYHSCAVAGGQVYCWGENADGQLALDAAVGVDVNDRRIVSTARPVLAGASHVAAAHRSTCAVLATGAVRCWGQRVIEGDVSATPTPVAAFEP
ncbi:MAG: hypothetical protein R2939_09425 [Kofleriaceae bacterium]